MAYKPKWYDNKQFLQMLYIDKGWSMSEIASYIGISFETVRVLLAKHNITKGK